MANGNRMAKQSTKSKGNGKNPHKHDIYHIGHKGNQIEIDSLGLNSYRVIIRDHYTQNYIDYYLNKEELLGLADFINRYLEQK